MRLHFLVVLSLSIFISSCDTPVQRFDNLNGTIVSFGYRPGTLEYLPTNGTTYRIKWPGLRDPLLICRAKGDTLILASDTILHGSDRVDVVRFLYKANPVTGTFQKIEQLSNAISSCNGLDFDEKSDTYLYSGRYNDKRGIFLFDRDFNLKEDLTSLCTCPVDPDNNKIYENARWIAGDNVIYTCNRHTYIKGSTPFEFSDSAVIAAVSTSRTKILYYFFHPNDDHVYLYDVISHENKKLNINNMSILSGAFSPDESRIVFGDFTHDLGNSTKIYIYDLATNVVTYTGVNCDGSLYWGDFSASFANATPYLPKE